MTPDPVFWANESLRVAFDQRDLDAFDEDTRAKYSVPLYTKPPDQAEIERRADCYPDLLDALQNLLKVYQGVDGARYGAGAIAKAAIAKATGVSNDQG